MSISNQFIYFLTKFTKNDNIQKLNSLLSIITLFSNKCVRFFIVLNGTFDDRKAASTNLKNLFEFLTLNKDFFKS
jgi:hypothetical protein